VLKLLVLLMLLSVQCYGGILLLLLFDAVVSAVALWRLVNGGDCVLVEGPCLGGP